MKKAILISIKPKYVADILNGRKTIEIRKTMPKCDLPIDVYIYCTKDLKSGKKVLTWLNEKWLSKVKTITYLGNDILGKVVAKFTLNKVEETDHIVAEELLKSSCLTFEELANYVFNKKTSYAWHIDNLEIFDKPKELSEFNYWNVVKNNKYIYGEFPLKTPLTKAPQNYVFIETEE